MSLWKSHLLTPKDSQLDYDGPHPMQARLTFLPALCKDIQINQVQNQPIKKPFVTAGSAKQYPSSPPQDCGLRTGSTIFFVLFLNISLSSLVPHWIWHVCYVYTTSLCFTLSLLILLVFLLSRWILITQLLHIFSLLLFSAQISTPSGNLSMFSILFPMQ